MEPPAPIKTMKFEVPPEGEDWLWWHPDEPEKAFQNYFARRMTCSPCEVHWEQEVRADKPIRCFVCGKFKRKPKV